MIGNTLTHYFQFSYCNKEVSHNVEHWRGLGICCDVRPADAHIKERKF